MSRIFSLTRYLAALIFILLSGSIASACTRSTVGIFALSSQLNYVHHYCPITLYPCSFGVGADYEIKHIAVDGGPINQWLTTTTDPSATYNAVQQDAIILNAKGIAAAFKPAQKYVHSVNYFWTVVPDLGVSRYLVGANVTYARCVPFPNPFPRR